MTPRLSYAILSMDAYNRGYEPAIKDLPSGSIGGTLLRTDVPLPIGSVEAGFFAQAYTLANGRTVISYRGTSTNNEAPLDNDKANGWSLGFGSGASVQALQAVDFYRAVAGPTNSPYAANIITTGHSLGGGLAGFVATLYGKQSEVYDPMAWAVGTVDAYGAAIVSNTLGDGSFKNRLYGSYAIKSLNSSKVFSSRTVGEGLGFISPVPSKTYSIGDTGLLGILEITPFQRHSQALLVSLIYADENIGQTNWQDAASPLWKAYFNEAVAKSLPATTNIKGDGYSEGSVMQSAIAYSAIKTGTMPFGNTGIDAMFDDAGDLGKVLKPNNAATIVKDQADDIANVFVQYAGGLALSKVTGGVNSKAADGVLKLATDQSTLAIDFGDVLWSKVGSPETIVGRQEILDAVLDQETPDSTIRGDIAAGMKDAYDDENFKTIDRVLLPTTDGQVIATLEKRDGAGKQTLLVSGTGDDTITGAAGNEMIHGGEGIDKIDGGGGIDLLYGGDGNDELIGGAGNDFLFGGKGVDNIKGGLNNDRFFADLDGEGDLLDGEDGTDTIVYRFETPLLPDPDDGYGGGYGGGYSRAPVKIELTSTTNSARASMADFGISIIGLPDDGFGDDGLTSIEKATIEAGEEDDTLTIASNAKVTEGMTINLGGGKNVVDLENQINGITVDLSQNLVRVSPRGTARSITVIGASKVIGGSGIDTLTAGNDGGVQYSLYGAGGDDNLFGKTGNDTLVGGFDNDKMFGNEGNDYLDGGSGDDELEGGIGNDALSGDFGNDKLTGGEGNDELSGAAGSDELFGGIGNDILYGNGRTNEDTNARDTLHGGVGNDVVNLLRTSGIAYGDEGDDKLYSENYLYFPGFETLFAGSNLYGGTGSDLLYGGQGDYLTGGSDADEFNVTRGATVVDLALDDAGVYWGSFRLEGGRSTDGGSTYQGDGNTNYKFNGSTLIAYSRFDESSSISISNFTNGAGGIFLSVSEGAFGAQFGTEGDAQSAQIAFKPNFDEILVAPSATSAFAQSAAQMMIQAMACFGAERNVGSLDRFGEMHNGRHQYLDFHAMS